LTSEGTISLPKAKATAVFSACCTLVHRDRQIKTLGPDFFGHAMAHRSPSANKSDVLHGVSVEW